MQCGLQWSRRSVLLAVTAFILLLCWSMAAAHETGGSATEHPGFRPGSPYANEFVASLADASIAVHPALLRRSERTAHSYAARTEALAILRSAGIDAIPGNVRPDLGRLFGSSQWGVFEADLALVGDAVKGRHSQASYHLVLEFLLPISDDAIFGIECYVVDQQGNDVFSFLLSSHHQVFVDAYLGADGSEAARKAMFARATQAGIAALLGQVEFQRGKGARAEARKAALEAGDFEEFVFDDFESPVSTVLDENGLQLGFVKFAHERSVIGIGTTREHPPVPGAEPGNQVLRLEMVGRRWAGFAHLFFYTDEQTVLWTPYDWRRFDGIAFWFHGEGRGDEMFIDIIDNRNPGSTSDDAERFTYTFKDDATGWRRILVPFEDFQRKEVGNGAPNDGLGLMTVHGWAIGTSGTEGQATYFVDDFMLQHVGLEGHEPGAGADVDYPINELPMYGLREKTPEQLRADEKYIRTMTKGGHSRQQAAEIAARMAWNVLYSGDKAMAIRRFNQAWLLDPDNQLALWGFAVTCIDRQQFDEALRYYRLAIESGPSNPALDRDYRLLLRQLDKMQPLTQ